MSLAPVVSTGLLLLGHASHYWRQSLACLSWEMGVSSKCVLSSPEKLCFLLLLHCRLLTAFSHSEPQSRSLFCSTVLNYFWGAVHHSLTPALRTITRRSKFIQFQHFDAKFNMLKIRDSEQLTQKNKRYFLTQVKFFPEIKMWTLEFALLK